MGRALEELRLSQVPQGVWRNRLALAKPQKSHSTFRMLGHYIHSGEHGLHSFGFL